MKKNNTIVTILLVIVIVIILIGAVIFGINESKTEQTTRETFSQVTTTSTNKSLYWLSGSWQSKDWNTIYNFYFKNNKWELINENQAILGKNGVSNKESSVITITFDNDLILDIEKVSDSSFKVTKYFKNTQGKSATVIFNKIE